MWSLNHDVKFRAFITIIVGVVFMMVTQAWSTAPQIAALCVDSIVQVERIKFGSCEPGQILSYVRDRDGSQYIVCRCHWRGSAINSREEPDVPELIFKTLDPNLFDVEPEETSNTNTSDETELSL